MVADYLTKPLHSKLFYKFRDQIMGVVPMDAIVGDHSSVLVQNVTKNIDESKYLTSDTRTSSILAVLILTTNLGQVW